ncbi:MAG: hypothetical protein HZC43_00430 [Nitrosomonadales bacterium]|nr:hypothetical protein [Nitrosomonadales bacterium]
MMTIGPENFMFARLALGMTQEQCAAYLRTTTTTIHRWESGLAPVPFAEFELLRLVLESVSFKFSHPEWDGWFMSQKGELVSPIAGDCCYTPSDLNLLPYTHAKNSRLAGEVRRLEAALNLAAEENTRLRQMFLSQGVVDELYSLQDRMNGLIKQLATARVVPFPAAADVPLEKAA